MLKGELLLGVVTFLVAVFLFWVTGNFTGQGTQMGPTYWPRILLTFLMLFSAIVSVNAIRRITREKGWSQSLLIMDKGKVRLIAAIAMIIAYFIFLKLMGFIIVTPLFMIAFMVLLGEKSKFWMMGVPIAMTIVIVVLFTKAMYVPLPRGEWIFREISLLFY